jgi:penicillin-binding protein 1A
MIEILEGVVQRGTGRGLASLGRPLGGKTGTTNDSKDLWFIGFSPNLVVGAFAGFDEPRSLGAHVTGASVAAPIVKKFLAKALEGRPPIPFHTPPELRLARVDSRTGQAATPSDPGAIWEAFLLGSEPGIDHPEPPGQQCVDRPRLEWATELASRNNRGGRHILICRFRPGPMWARASNEIL